MAEKAGALRGPGIPAIEAPLRLSRLYAELMAPDYDPADHYTANVQKVYEAADESRNPMSADYLFELAAESGVNSDSFVLDVGCANGGNSRKLLARTGCKMEGVDYLQDLVVMGQRENRAAGVDHRFNIQQGSMLDLPFPAKHFDFVFCRDTLGGEETPKAIRECQRVLRPGKSMLVYVTLPTRRLSAAELGDLQDNLGVSMDESSMDACLSQEFILTRKVVLGSQGVQYQEESGDNTATRNLLRIARLITWERDYIAEHGERAYSIALADLKWQVYMLLGKLQGIIYVLRNVS